MINIIIFIFITLFLINRLIAILGLHIGYKIEVKNDNLYSNKNEDFIEEVKNSDGQSVGEKIQQISKIYGKFDVIDFIDKAKKVFEIVFESYANGDKHTLKDLLASRIYDAFVMAIDDRISRNEVLEGILIRFISAEIIDAAVQGDDILITMSFVTEQSNVLKSRDGVVLDGNSDFVEKRTDVWVFQRKTNSSDPRWFLREIKDQE